MDDATYGFRCANGCDGDGAGGDGTPSSSAWTASVTFPVGSAGTYTVYSENHAGMDVQMIISGAPTAVSLGSSAVEPNVGLSTILFGLIIVLLSSASVFGLRRRNS